MKKLLCMFTCLCLTLMTAVAFAEETESVLQPATLTVIGEAQVQVEADAAEMVLGVRTRMETVAEASTTNSTTLDAVIAALHAAGVAAEDIVTEHYAVSPMYDYNYGKLEQTQTLTGYEVENRLRVTVRDTQQLGALLDVGMQAGANIAYGISYLSSQSAAAKDEALTAAIAEGRRKAELMAAACGQTLGELQSVTESISGGYGGVSLKYNAEDSASGTAILTDDLTVAAQVTLTFALNK